MTSMSPEQAAFRSYLMVHPERSVLLEAVAGSGKTTSLIQNLDIMAQHGSTVLMAFNKKIAVELQARIDRLADKWTAMNTTAGTVHSLGLKAWSRAGFRSRVNGNKLSFLWADMLTERGIEARPGSEHPLYKHRRLFVRAVSYAKNRGFGLTSGAEEFPGIADAYAWSRMLDHFNMSVDIDDAELDQIEFVDLAIKLLARSNESTSIIDFDDMIYLPLLRNLKLPQFKNVVIDEAQDTNVVRREMAFRMLAPGGRLIAVGDPHQAIYGFTGADAHALNNIARRANAERLPLSVCWRCDAAIIAHAREVVSHIVSWDKENRGSVTEVPFDDQFMDKLTEGDAILCRLNKPNVSLAIGLLRRGKVARIEGRDLGDRLLSHARKAAGENNKPELDVLQLQLNSYREHQVMLLLKHEKDADAALLEDEIDAVEVLLDRCQEQGHNQFRHLEDLVQLLFQDEAHKQKCILLSSVHKSKGLEWPRVYLLGRDDYMPFWKAQLPWEQEQEQNLIYVAITRAQHELIEVTGVKAALEEGLHRSGSRATTAIGPDRVKHQALADLDLSEDISSMLKGIDL